MSNRTRTHAPRTLALPVMPDRTITVLSLSAGFLFAAYLVLVIITIAFATMQTTLASSVRATEGTISELETTYYASLTKEDATTPASAGLVAPTVVEYAIAKPAQGISFAGK